MELVAIIAKAALLFVVLMELRAIAQGLVHAFTWPSNVVLSQDRRTGEYKAHKRVKAVPAVCRLRMFVCRWLVCSPVLHQAYMLMRGYKAKWNGSWVGVLALCAYLAAPPHMPQDFALALAALGGLALFLVHEARKYSRAMDEHKDMTHAVHKAFAKAK